VAGYLKICTLRRRRVPAAAQLPLPPAARKRHLRKEKVGSMSRPDVEGIIFDERFDLVAFEFGAREHAEFTAGPEERDWNHEGAGELEGVVLCERKIVGHPRAPSSERANPARWLRQCPAPVAITAKAKPSGGSLLADPSRVDRGRSGAGPGSRHGERDWHAFGDTRRDGLLSALQDTCVSTEVLLPRVRRPVGEEALGFQLVALPIGCRRDGRRIFESPLVVSWQEASRRLLSGGTITRRYVHLGPPWQSPD